MSETRMSRISDETKDRIKNIVKYHYGFTPKDSDIEWIDKMLTNNYGFLHEQQIIRELAANNISKELLKHRDRIGSEQFERIERGRDIFRYLTFASMCFRAGIPAGTICLCRTAIESGLRERLAEELAREENTSNSELPGAILNKLKRLEKDEKYNSLAKLIKEVPRKINEEQKIEGAFQELKFKGQEGRKILDKFIHGDIVWLVNFARNRKNIEVRGAEGRVKTYKLVPDKEGEYNEVFEKEEDYKVSIDKLEEYKIIAESEINEIAIKVLKATYRIAEILYYKNI